MLFKLAAILPMLATLAIGAPLNETPTEAGLVVRSGDRQASVYSGSGCSGVTLGADRNFGCGGTCHQTSSPIFSILLVQENVGNPKPTASLFAGRNCDGEQVASAGIFAGEHSGCTNLGKGAYSYYLYYDC
ncbi:hypothetical protein AJ79_03937 [Helicocarpus griseus UAMH5409]|uniref:Uncharacterized protein n=1 Tax=Helicocarpus griseus UAMH5409 TaxID=1447875 RepID=A0A2B7XMG7_9EURO|nr:hypothetical protein AJ79_03937 [Helicocarpus griseus UAMH5409]